MAISDRENELISKYLDDNLSVEDSKEFDEFISNSSEFKKELVDQQAILAGIKAYHRDNLKKEFGDAFTKMDAENTSETKTVAFRPKAYWYAVAAAVLLLIVFIPSLFNSDPLSNEQLYAQFYEPLSLNTTSRDDVDTPKGLELYQAGKYAEAISYLDQLSNENTYKMAIVYLGVAYMEVGEFDKAQAVFSKISKGKFDPFQKQYADWYLILIQLKNGKNLSELEKQIDNINTGGGIFSKEAKKLLNELN